MTDGGRRQLSFCPLCHKIGKRLQFDGGAGGTLDALSHELKRPFGNSPRGIWVSHHFAERKGCDHRDRMRLEIVPLFALGDQHRVKELLDLGVSGFGFAQDFAHKVHRSLYFQSMPFFLPFYN